MKSTLQRVSFVQTYEGGVVGVACLQDVIRCELISRLESMDEERLEPRELNVQDNFSCKMGLTSIPRVGMRVRIWQTRQKVKNSPAIILTVSIEL